MFQIEKLPTESRRHSDLPFSPVYQPLRRLVGGEPSRLDLPMRPAKVLSIWLISVGCLCACSKENPQTSPQDLGISSPDRPVMMAQDASVFADASSLDLGGPIVCQVSCDCPAGQRCKEGLCQDTSSPIWCCSSSQCPPERICLDSSEQPGRCPSAPDAGTISPMPAQLGEACRKDEDCQQGLSCWRRDQVPGLWGNICVKESCLRGGCEGFQRCLSFSEPQVQSGCFLGCQNHGDCPRGTHCGTMPGSTFLSCIPNCQDDFLDCHDPQGRVYCHRERGDCQNLVSASPVARVGDACLDNRGCGPGQFCLGETHWQMPGGVCTSICRGHPQAEPCESQEEVCLMHRGLGLCFRGCEDGLCPRRPEARCQSLSLDWPSKACLP